METLKTINFVIAVIFFVCYTYQFLYIPVPWLRKARPHGPAKDNRYAVLICARNEQRVIGDLIASLRGQTYSQSLLSIFVLADNCTDDTAMVARVAGAGRSCCPSDRQSAAGAIREMRGDHHVHHPGLRR